MFANECLHANGVPLNNCTVDKDGNDREFKGDSIVVCRGFLPDKTMTNALTGKIKEVLAMGDCVEARLIYKAIHEGWVAANQI